MVSYHQNEKWVSVTQSHINDAAVQLRQLVFHSSDTVDHLRGASEDPKDDRAFERLSLVFISYNGEHGFRAAKLDFLIIASDDN